jgi:hypothetical protein
MPSVAGRGSERVAREYLAAVGERLLLEEPQRVGAAHGGGEPGVGEQRDGGAVAAHLLLAAPGHGAAHQRHHAHLLGAAVVDQLDVVLPRRVRGALRRPLHRAARALEVPALQPHLGAGDRRRRVRLEPGTAGVAVHRALHEEVVVPHRRDKDATGRRRQHRCGEQHRRRPPRHHQLAAVVRPLQTLVAGEMRGIYVAVLYA